MMSAAVMTGQQGPRRTWAAAFVLLVQRQWSDKAAVETAWAPISCLDLKASLYFLHSLVRLSRCSSLASARMLSDIQWSMQSIIATDSKFIHRSSYYFLPE